MGAIGLRNTRPRSHPNCGNVIQLEQTELQILI